MPTSDKKVEDIEAVLTAIAEMPDDDRKIAKRLHEIITHNGPDLDPRTWYGMPAYSNGAKIVCFFRSKKKFGERYMTLGFNDSAHLDEGTFWPFSYAITALDDEIEATIATLVRKAVS